MFYRPEDGHPLPHNPFNAIITPRPIGWIATRSAGGVDNLAPYSFFNGVAYTPPQVMFASTATKDSLNNIRATGVFCVNIVAAEMTQAMNVTSDDFPPEVDEFDRAGIARAACETIACSRVAGAPAALECRAFEIVPLKGSDNHLVLGEVTGVHLRDDCIVAGRFDVTRFAPLARLGYRDYSVIRELFELKRPSDG
ncbi:MAG: flavin reductase family protein [Alphaproteobacteria bacterium]|nr:MAG: flavin reductase family protein [Alphaproteobacteria bacterium]